MFISRSRILPARRACAALIPAVCVGGLSVERGQGAVRRKQGGTLSSMMFGFVSVKTVVIDVSTLMMMRGVGLSVAEYRETKRNPSTVWIGIVPRGRRSTEELKLEP